MSDLAKIPKNPHIVEKNPDVVTVVNYVTCKFTSFLAPKHKAYHKGLFEALLATQRVARLENWQIDKVPM